VLPKARLYFLSAGACFQTLAPVQVAIDPADPAAGIRILLAKIDPQDIHGLVPDPITDVPPIDRVDVGLPGR